MKQLTLTLLSFVLLATAAMAQNNDAALEKNKSFTGAKATKKMYHTIYQLDNADPKIIEKALRNINNALNDLKALVQKGVIIAQCNNSLKERKITRDQLYDFVAVVPSGNGELIIRQGEGWASIKP
jgi:intracellular sulfur oxidation DsrE/DsrF family protein